MAAKDPRRLLWSKLRDGRLGGHEFRRQHPIGPFMAEFCCVDANLVVEIADAQPDADAVTADARRTTFFHLQGFTPLRFEGRKVIDETESVLESIRQGLGTPLKAQP